MPIDQDARDMAAKALQRIEAHETLCANRWEQARESMSDLKEGISALWRQAWLAAAGVIDALLAILYVLMGEILPRLAGA